MFVKETLYMTEIATKILPVTAKCISIIKLTDWAMKNYSTIATC